MSKMWVCFLSVRCQAAFPQRGNSVKQHWKDASCHLTAAKENITEDIQVGCYGALEATERIEEIVQGYSEAQLLEALFWTR